MKCDALVKLMSHASSHCCNSTRNLNIQMRFTRFHLAAVTLAEKIRTSLRVGAHWPRPRPQTGTRVHTDAHAQSPGLSTAAPAAVCTPAPRSWLLTTPLPGGARAPWRNGGVLSGGGEEPGACCGRREDPAEQDVDRSEGTQEPREMSLHRSLPKPLAHGDKS